MKKPWVRAAIALLTLALLAWLLRAFDWPAWWSRLAALPGWLWALVPVGMALSYGCRAARVHAELSLTLPVSLVRCLRLSLVHNLAIHLVPMRGGELAYPALLQRELGVPVPTAMASLAWMRLQDALVLLAVALLLAPVAWPARMAALAVGAAVLVFGVRALRARARTMAERSDASPPPGRIKALLQRSLAALTDPSRHTATGWLYCVGNWTIKLAVIATVLAALTHLPTAAALRGALGGELAALSPLQGPSGLGTYEAGVWVGAAAVPGDHAAVPVADVALAALTAHAFIFLTALVAGGLALLVPARADAAPAATPTERLP